MRFLGLFAGAALAGVVGVLWLAGDRPTPSGVQRTGPAPAQSARAPGPSAGSGQAAPRGPAVREEPRRALAPAPAAWPSSLIIRVLDGFDGPLGGAEVRLRGGPRRSSLMTGGDGQVAFEGLAAGSYGYRIAAPEQPPLRSAAPVRLAAGEMRLIEVRLAARDRALAGSVVDQDGAPMVGLTVKARLYRPPADPGLLVPESAAGQSSVTAADGGFEIAALADGEYQVLAVASERSGAATAVARAGSTGLRLVVAERREQTVYGAVTDTTGAALADARVVDLEQPSRRTRTDAFGRYEMVVEASAGGHTLRFAADGHRGASLEVAGEQAEARLDAALEPLTESVAVAVRVSDATGAPVAGQRVYLSSRALGTHYQAVSDSAGAARFVAIASGTDYALRVLPGGLYQDHVQPAVDLAAPLEIILSALETATLGGRIVDAAGVPVPDFSLRVESTLARGRVLQVTGDADGYFEVAAMPTGPQLFSAAAPPHRISGSHPGCGRPRRRRTDGRLGPTDARGARARCGRAAVAGRHGRARLGADQRTGPQPRRAPHVDRQRRGVRLLGPRTRPA